MYPVAVLLPYYSDSSGTAVQRNWFDPWGAQRNADGSADASCSLPAASLTTRGYTSQEEMPNVCLINYNARIYDPQIARFLSADSTVPNPFNGQSLNRYSYVNNNPLAFVDPSGNVTCVNDGLICYKNVKCTANCNSTGMLLSGPDLFDEVQNGDFLGLAANANPGFGFNGVGSDPSHGSLGDNSGSSVGWELNTSIPVPDNLNANNSEIETIYATFWYTPIYNFSPNFSGLGAAGNTNGLNANGAWSGTGSWTDRLPRGAGFLFGFNGDAGIGRRGAAAQYSIGLGYALHGPLGFESAGGVWNLGGTPRGFPPQNSPSTVLGGYGGAGVGVFLTNATDENQVLGPFQAMTINIPGVVAAQYAFSGKTYILSFTFGPGALVSYTNYTTTTQPWGLFPPAY